MKVPNWRSMDHFHADEWDVFVVKILVHTSKLVKWSILVYYNWKTADCCGNIKVTLILLFPQQSAVFIWKTADCCGNSKLTPFLLFPQQTAVFIWKTADCCGNSKLTLFLLFPQQSAVFYIKTADCCGKKNHNKLYTKIFFHRTFNKLRMIAFAWTEF